MREISSIILLLCVIFVVGQLWFHFVEGILAKVMGRLPQKEIPWHPLETDESSESSESKQNTPQKP